MKTVRSNAPEDGVEEQHAASERFRALLRERLVRMRDNARRTGSSQMFIDSIDHNADLVLSVLDDPQHLAARLAKPSTNKS